MAKGKRAAANSNGLRTRIVGHDRVPASEIMQNPFNHRRHGRRQQKVVSASLDELGIVKSLLVNRTTGHLIDGHDRLRDALSRGDGTLVDVEYVELSEVEERTALAILDAAVGMADVDAEAFDDLLAELSPDSPVLDDWFGELYDGIKDQLNDDRKNKDPLDAPAKVDEAAQLREKWGTAPGDLWELGDHRLICGDSTVKAVIAQLLDGQVPQSMITDPPYGVQYDPEWRNKAGVSSTKRLGKVANDDRASWAGAWVHFPGDIAYVWHAGAYASEVERSLQVCKFDVVSQIIWVKNRFAMSRGSYHWRHEPCHFVVRKGATQHWDGGRRQQTVWADIVDSYQQDDLFAARAVDEDSVVCFPAEWTTVWEIKPSGPNDKATVHGTQKPTECFARPMRNHKCGIVYDPFAGSGSVFIAAENEGRQALGCELDPAYVAVILERYQEATGKVPVKVA